MIQDWKYSRDANPDSPNEYYTMYYEFPCGCCVKLCVYKDYKKLKTDANGEHYYPWYAEVDTGKSCSSKEFGKYFCTLPETFKSESAAKAWCVNVFNKKFKKLKEQLDSLTCIE